MQSIPDNCTIEQKDIFLHNLRSSTATMHKQLESGKLSVSLMKDDVSVKDYIAYLCRMKDVISFYETEIFPVVQEFIPDISERRKQDLIEKDLEALQDVEKESQYVFSPLQGSINLPFAMGYMYVIEGSTLGGRVILKHIKNKLGIDEVNGGAFFAGYREDTGRKWKTFLDILCAYAVEQEAEAGVIEGAKHAFNSIHEHFSRS